VSAQGRDGVVDAFSGLMMRLGAEQICYKDTLYPCVDNALADMTPP